MKLAIAIMQRMAGKSEQNIAISFCDEGISGCGTCAASWFIVFETSYLLSNIKALQINLTVPPW